MPSLSIQPHIKHTNADTIYATQKLAEGYSRDEVVSLLQTERLLGGKAAVTCVTQILWGQAGGDKEKEHEISDWSVKASRKEEQYKKAAETLVQLSKNTSTEGGGGRKKTNKKRKGRKGKGRKTRGRK